MAKVMQTITVKVDNTVISKVTKEFQEYAKVEYAAHVVADMDPLGDEQNRMKLIGSEFYFDPDCPMMTMRRFEYRLGSVIYNEIYQLNED